MANAIQKLKNKKVFLCPICIPDNSNIEDPLFFKNVEHFSFLSIQSLLLHLNYTHKASVPLTFGFFKWLQTFRLRGNDGLISQYWEEFNLCKHLTSPLSEYWIDVRREAYNDICSSLLKYQNIDNTIAKIPVNNKECTILWESQTGRFWEEEHDYVHLNKDMSDFDEISETEVFIDI